MLSTRNSVIDNIFYRIPLGGHLRVFIVVTELAAILVGDENGENITKHREAVLRNHGGRLQLIQL